MKLSWGLFRGPSPAVGEQARAVLWGAVLAVLGGLLASQAWRGRAEAAEVQRQSSALDRQIARMKGANQAMREEVRALESDPVYIESVLRRWKRAGTGERTVE